jgi:hypothetical protein
MGIVVMLMYPPECLILFERINCSSLLCDASCLLMQVLLCEKLKSGEGLGIKRGVRLGDPVKHEITRMLIALIDHLRTTHSNPRYIRRNTKILGPSIGMF